MQQIDPAVWPIKILRVAAQACLSNVAGSP